MDVLLLRHAEAGEAATDDARELTPRGRDQARAVAKGMAALDLGIDTVFSSPLPRALQTVEAVAAHLGLGVVQDDALRSGRSAGHALSLLDAHAHTMRRCVLLVGHEPQLSALLLHLTGGRIHMRKAMLAGVDVLSLDPSYGALSFLLSWRHLERLGRSRVTKGRAFSTIESHAQNDDGDDVLPPVPILLLPIARDRAARQGDDERA